ncbi:MAG: CHAP domain-containing protein [Sandaracinaceae bacterium]
MRVLAFASLLLLASPNWASAETCDAECAGHGACFTERGTLACLCEPGYAAVGLTCVATEHDELASRARHAARIGERVVAIAEAQVGRRRAQVRDGDDALDDYLSDEEWWCSDFVAWTYMRAGVPLDGGAMGGWLVTNNEAVGAWFAARDRWHPRGDGYVPRPGDFVRMPTERGGHAAIVTHVRGTTLHTVEGNVSGEVARGVYYHYPQNPLLAGFGQVALDNEPPAVELDAPESDAIVGLPLVLHGAVRDDGPADALAIRFRASAPDVVVQADGPDAIVTFRRPGRFEIGLEADDGEHTTRVTVDVRARTDDPPIVALRARDGAPLFAVLEASVDDEASPALLWEAVSGPGEVELADPERARTDATFSAPGRYELALTADDGTHRVERRIVVDVQAAGIGVTGIGCAVSPAAQPRRGLIPTCVGACLHALALLGRVARRSKTRGPA